MYVCALSMHVSICLFHSLQIISSFVCGLECILFWFDLLLVIPVYLFSGSPALLLVVLSSE